MARVAHLYHALKIKKKKFVEYHVYDSQPAFRIPQRFEDLQTGFSVRKIAPAGSAKGFFSQKNHTRQLEVGFFHRKNHHHRLRDRFLRQKTAPAGSANGFPIRKTIPASLETGFSVRKTALVSSQKDFPIRRTAPCQLPEIQQTIQISDD